MNLDDLNEAPMGMLNKMGQKVLSKVPGSIGATAQGKLDTGAVANEWKKEFMTYLGRIGEKNPSTETLLGFLKTKGFEPDEIGDVVKESMMYERAISNRELDQMFLKVAQKAATTGKTASSPGAEPEVNPTAPRKPGMIDKAVNFARNAVVGKTPQQKVEPTIPPPPTARPAQAAGTAAVQKAVSPAAKQKQTPHTGVNNYLNTWAADIKGASSPQQRMELAREMIKFLNDRKGSAEGKMAANAAAAVIKRLHDPRLEKVVQGFKTLQMERANYIMANYILEEIGLSWKDLGLRIIISESTATHITIACR